MASARTTGCLLTCMCLKAAALQCMGSCQAAQPAQLVAIGVLVSEGLTHSAAAGEDTQGAHQPGYILLQGELTESKLLICCCICLRHSTLACDGLRHCQYTLSRLTTLFYLTQCTQHTGTINSATSCAVLHPGRGTLQLWVLFWAVCTRRWATPPRQAACRTSSLSRCRQRPATRCFLTAMRCCMSAALCSSSTHPACRPHYLHSCKFVLP